MPTARRTLTLALLLVAASSLILTTGAAVIDGDADTIADGDLAIQPADGPNGQYAYLNDDEEIAIDVSASNPNIRDSSFDGVNVGATGTIDDVFTVTYTGDEYARVWIEYESDNVTFVADGESIEGNGSSVTLAPNGTVAVGLALDTRGAEAGTQLGADEFTIEANETALGESDESGASTSTASSSTGSSDTVVTTRAPSDDSREFAASEIDRDGAVEFETGGMHLDGANVTLDGLDVEGVRTERVEMSATGSPDPVENGSALDAPTTPRSIAYLAVEHDFDPDEVDAMAIRFSASRARLTDAGIDPENVTLYRQTDAGEWEEKPVEVVGGDAARTRGLPEDRVHFRATTTEFSTFAVAEHVPRFDVTEAVLETPAIDPGEEATVRATVENDGGAAGTETVTLTADGEPVANETVALAPNGTTTVALSDAFGTAGEYDLEVVGADARADAGTLFVGDPAADGSDGGADAGAGTGSGADGGARDGAGGGDGAGATGGSGAGPTEEPGGIDLVELGGLLALVALAVAAIALVRRTSGS